MSQIIGAKGFMLDEAEEHLDTQVMPPREHRRALEAVEAERQRWVAAHPEGLIRTLGSSTT